jgi:hypothetical protein
VSAAAVRLSLTRQRSSGTDRRSTVSASCAPLLPALRAKSRALSCHPAGLILTSRPGLLLPSAAARSANVPFWFARRNACVAAPVWRPVVARSFDAAVLGGSHYTFACATTRQILKERVC